MGEKEFHNTLEFLVFYQMNSKSQLEIYNFSSTFSCKKNYNCHTSLKLNIRTKEYVRRTISRRRMLKNLLTIYM